MNSIREITILMSCVEINILIYFFQCKLYQRKDNNFIHFICRVIFLGVSYYINLQNIPVLNMVFIIFYMLLTSMVFYDVKCKAAYLYILYFVLLLLIVDITVSSIFGAWGDGLKKFLENDEQYFISSIAILVLNIIAYKILTEKLVKYELSNIKKHEIIYIFFIGLFEIIGLICIALIFEKTDENGTVLMFFGLGFMLLISYQLYNNRITTFYYEELKRKEVEKINEKLVIKHYAMIEEKNLYYRRMEHDIRKHLNAIEKLVFENEKATVDSYISDIKEKLTNIKGSYIYRNKTLQIIINEMYHKCQLLDIKCIINIENNDLDFLAVYDLTIIFGNLIDNAIEACGSVEKMNKFIIVRMYEFGDYVIIHVENSFNGRIMRDKEQILSTKGKQRGLGLKNVYEVVEKYSGDMEIEDKENFIVKIILQKY